MPNDCLCALTLCGPFKDLQEIENRVAAHAQQEQERIKNEPFVNPRCIPDLKVFSFSAFVPLPEDCCTGREAVAMWETKWNPYDCMADNITVTDTGACRNYSFFTAWSPPDSFLVKFSSMYPEIEMTLTYEERGMDFAGRFVCKAGDTLVGEDLSIEWSSDEDQSDDESDEKDSMPQQPRVVIAASA